MQKKKSVNNLKVRGNFPQWEKSSGHKLEMKALQDPGRSKWDLDQLCIEEKT